VTAIANLTPVSTVALPWTYVTNGGQAYSLSSAQGAGCVDTVTPLTANAGGTFNVKGVPLYPSQSYGVIAQADQQYGPIVIACQSLVNQLGSSSTANSGVPSQWPDIFGGAFSANAFIDDAIGIVVVAFLIIFVLWVAEKVLGKKVRR
jgi:hypothetical protein